MSGTCKSANWQTCPDIESNSPSLEIVEIYCYLGDTIGVKYGAADSVITRTRSGWTKFRDLMSSLTSRDSPWVAKDRLHFPRIYGVMLYGGETWQVKEEDVIRLEKNDGRMYYNYSRLLGIYVIMIKNLHARDFYVKPENATLATSYQPWILSDHFLVFFRSLFFLTLNTTVFGRWLSIKTIKFRYINTKVQCLSSYLDCQIIYDSRNSWKIFIKIQKIKLEGSRFCSSFFYVSQFSRSWFLFWFMPDSYFTKHLWTVSEFSY